MVMPPALRRGALAVHVITSICWIGAVVAYLALGIAAVISDQPQTVRAAWIAMELTGWVVIVPLAVLAFLTGLVMSLGTAWGLVRHYWVIFAFVLTTVALVVLLLHMPSVTATAHTARAADDATVLQLGGDVLHPALGLLVLVVIAVLNLYKPRGTTRYGQRRRARDAAGKRSITADSSTS